MKHWHAAKGEKSMSEWENGGDHFPYVIGDLSLVIDGAIHCAMTNDIGKMTNEKFFSLTHSPIHLFIITVRAGR
jgi:hypothetical protein